jgi:hypothetical protein
MKKRILWSVYTDPTEEFINSKYHQELKKQLGLEDEDEDEDENEDRDENDTDSVSSKILNTPLGVISIGGPSFVSKYLDMWIIDFNFDVTLDIVNRIQMIVGVEALQVMSRYKLRVGFPKSGLFNIEEIKQNVEKAIFIEDINMSNQLDKFISAIFENKINFEEIRKPIADKYDMWAIYILPNGCFEILTHDKKSTEFDNMLQTYTKLQQMVGGKLITNKNYE